MKTFIVTGATSGLGLATAQALALMPGTRVILAVRDLPRGRAVAAAMGATAEAVALDLSSLADVERFVGSWHGDLAGLVNNAGVQITNATRYTQDGHEETFAVNHLAALSLTLGLLPWLSGGRVLFIGSGTHNPEIRMAKLFGFRGARFTTVADASKGVSDATTVRQSGLDNYATSKFLNTVTTIELARRHAPHATAFFALDPGLMPGTALGRTWPRAIQLLGTPVIRALGPLLPDSSTAERSGATAAWIMTAQELSGRTGEVFSFDREPSRQVWDHARDPRVGRQVVDESAALLPERPRTTVARAVFAQDGSPEGPGAVEQLTLSAEASAPSRTEQPDGDVAGRYRPRWRAHSA